MPRHPKISAPPHARQRPPAGPGPCRTAAPRRARSAAAAVRPVPSGIGPGRAGVSVGRSALGIGPAMGPCRAGFRDAAVCPVGGCSVARAVFVPVRCARRLGARPAAAAVPTGRVAACPVPSGNGPGRPGAEGAALPVGRSAAPAVAPWRAGSLAADRENAPCKELHP